MNKDALKPYKNIIRKALYPSFGNSISLSTGKSAIQGYKKTTNDLEGVLELMVFYVESGTQFTLDFGDINESFYYSMESMFMKAVDSLKNSEQAKIDLYLA